MLASIPGTPRCGLETNRFGQRDYVGHGAGAVDVFQVAGTDIRALPSVTTSGGARTSLFVPELDRFSAAARAGLLGSDASVRVMRPAS